MAEQLIDSLSTDFDPDAYRDEYREQLLAPDRTQGRRQGDRRLRGRGAAGDQGPRPDGGAGGEHRRGQGQAARSRRKRAKPKAKAPPKKRKRRKRNETLLVALQSQSPRSSPWPRARQVEVDGRELKLTNLDKVLYPEAGLHQGRDGRLLRQGGAGDGPAPERPRGDPAPLPGRGRRPRLRLLREALPQAPAEMGEDDARSRPGRTPGKIDFCVCDGLPTLIWMAQLAAIELHPSLSLARAPKRPTVLAFDLDPGPPADVVDCCRVALRLREMFGHFGVECFPKTSGSKGMQVYVPLTPKITYDETKPFAKAIAQLLEKQTPDQVVSKMKKVERERQGLRRLVPEPPAQNDDRRLLAAGPRAPHRLDAGHLGGGRGGGRVRRRLGPGLRGRRRAGADRASTATSSPRCWSWSRSCRTFEGECRSPPTLSAMPADYDLGATTGCRVALTSSRRRTGVV